MKLFQILEDNIMRRSVGFTREWKGNWSKVLNILSPVFPDIKFEFPNVGFGIIFNIPEEYDFDEVYNYIDDQFNYDYIISDRNLKKTRLIILSV